MRLLNLLLRLAPPASLALAACQEAAEPSPSDSAVPAASAGMAAATSLQFRQISAGGSHTCAVTTDDRAYCWGPSVKPVSGSLRFLEVSAGYSNTCGITTDYRAYCWGGDLVPKIVPGGRRYRQISAGLDYACAVTTADLAFCWGDNHLGQLGTGGGSTSDPTRVAGGHHWIRVFAAATHTCGTTLEHGGYCWGANVFGQTGSGIRAVSLPKPVKVAGGLAFRQVKPGSGYDAGLQEPELDTATGCGITTQDIAYCWGNGATGFAGASSTPHPVAGGRRYGYIHPGLFHTCALTLSHVPLCWGSNERGALGVPGIAFSTAPVRVSGGLTFVFITVAAVGRHSCGVTASHQAFCWGDNSSGQLGDGTRTSRSTPVPVTGGA